MAESGASVDTSVSGAVAPGMAWPGVRFIAWFGDDFDHCSRGEPDTEDDGDKFRLAKNSLGLLKTLNAPLESAPGLFLGDRGSRGGKRSCLYDGTGDIW